MLGNQNRYPAPPLAAKKRPLRGPTPAGKAPPAVCWRAEEALKNIKRGTPRVGAMVTN